MSSASPPSPASKVPELSGDANMIPTVTPTVTNNMTENEGNDAADAGDAKIPTSDCDKVAFYARLGLPHAEAVSLAKRTRQALRDP